MLQKLVHSDTKAPDGTGFNDPPVGLRRITEVEFARSEFFQYGFAWREYRQIHVVSDEDLTAAPVGFNHKIIMGHLYWMEDGTGYLIESRYWEGKVTYYQFGCKHSFKTVPNDKVIPECRGAYLHTYKCDRCGTEKTVDSSD